MRKKIDWKTVFNIFIVLFSACLLVYFCLSENGLIDLLKNAANFNKVWLLMAILCHLLNIVLDSYLIYIFTKNSVERYSIKNAFKTSMVGQFFSAITPGASGGQPMQIFFMSKQGIDPGVSTSALIQKFLVYQTTITVYSALSILVCFKMFLGTVNSVMWGLAIFGFIAQAFVIFLLIIFSFNKKITYWLISSLFNFLEKLKILKNANTKIEKLERQLQLFHIGNSQLYKNLNLVFKSHVITAIQLTCMFIVPYCIYRSFNLSGARVVDMVCTQAFVSMTSSFVPLPGASGASEGSFYVFFGMYFTESTIKSAILLWRIITYYLTILISAPFASLTNSKKVKTHFED